MSRRNRELLMDRSGTNSLASFAPAKALQGALLVENFADDAELNIHELLDDDLLSLDCNVGSADEESALKAGGGSGRACVARQGNRVRDPGEAGEIENRQGWVHGAGARRRGLLGRLHQCGAAQGRG